MPLRETHRYCKQCDNVLGVAIICYKKCRIGDESHSDWYKLQGITSECERIMSCYSQKETADFDQRLLRHHLAIRLLYICRFVGWPDEEKALLSTLLEMFCIHRHEKVETQHLDITVNCFCVLMDSLDKTDILKCLQANMSIRGTGTEAWRDVMLHKLIQEMCMVIRAGPLEVGHLRAMSVEAFQAYLDWTQTETGQGHISMTYSVMEYLRLRHVLIWAMCKSGRMESEGDLLMLARLPGEDTLPSMWPELLKPETDGNVWEFMPDPALVDSMEFWVQKLAFREQKGWGVVRFDLIHAQLLLTVLRRVLKTFPDVWQRVGLANDLRQKQWQAQLNAGNKGAVFSWDEETMSPELEVYPDKSVLGSRSTVPRHRRNLYRRERFAASTTRPMNRARGIWSWAIIVLETCGGLIVGFHERKEKWTKDSWPQRKKPLFYDTSWGWGLDSKGKLLHEPSAVQEMCSSEPNSPLRKFGFTVQEGCVIGVHLNMTDRVCKFSRRHKDNWDEEMEEVAFSDLPSELFPCVAMYFGTVRIQALVDDINSL